MKAATSPELYSSYDTYISIHAAREGGDAVRHTAREAGGIFQSTPPVKAATVVGLINGRLSSISIHAAREGGDHTQTVSCKSERISIHAAREGGDLGVEI